MMKKVLKSIQRLQKYSDLWWYQPLAAFLAAIDHYVIIIPVDGLLASSVLLNPKRWFSLAISFTIGSTVGCLGFVWILHAVGLEKLMSLFPAIFESRLWALSQDFFHQHGSWVVLISGASPLPQQPAVITTALAQVPFWTIAGMLITGRLIKFLFIAYISSFAPEKLSRLWGIQGELKEMDVPKDKILKKPF
jgi:membrane protein YqaA with SNARE-associated domain